MKKMALFSLFPLFLMNLYGSVYAQAPIQFGANFMIGVPQNEFRENVDNLGYGGSGFFSYHFPNSFLSLGAGLSVLIYGIETREEPWSETTPYVFVDVTTQNTLISGYFFLRFQTPHGVFRPYIEGLLGLNYLTTDTRIEDQGDYEDIASSNNYRDTTYRYGIGGGGMFRIYQAPDDDYGMRKLNAVYLDLGFRYTKGGNAEYLKEGSITVDEGEVFYDVSESTTDLLAIYLGVVFAIWP